VFLAVRQSSEEGRCAPNAKKKRETLPYSRSRLDYMGESAGGTVEGERGHPTVNLFLLD